MLLEMHDIRKEVQRGPERILILRGIDLSVEEGDYVAIMGPSGSGKTTLLNLVGCLDVPTSGSYTFAGRDITACSAKELSRLRNRDIGFVFQTFHLLPKLTALDNVALPLLYGGVRKAERRARAQEALERVGLADRMSHRPDQLSGGQSQRVAIARAVATNPRLILADEPTGALDSASGQAIMELFDDLHRDGATIVMITHDADVARCADSIIHLRDGVFVDEPATSARGRRAHHGTSAPGYGHDPARRHHE